MTIEQKVREILNKHAEYKALGHSCDDEATAEIMRIIEEEKKKCITERHKALSAMPEEMRKSIEQGGLD